MEVLLVSGIWPPDVGGPASHGPEFGEFLTARGHRVRAVTSSGPGPPPPSAFPLTTSSRERVLPVRLATGAVAVTRAARGADVIYATGLYARSALASRARSLPVVMKLVNDPAYERARSLGLFSGTLEEFQAVDGGARIRALRRLREWTLERASRVVIPSHYLARIAGRWGLPQQRIRVIPNPAPVVDRAVPREELRRRLGVEGPTFVYAGRLVKQKNVTMALSALRAVQRATLVLIGDGPEEGTVARAIEEEGLESRVAMKGPLPRDETIGWMRAADAVVLPSDWENFPHAAVESLAAGTPVVATSVGGVPEIVEPGVNGLLVGRGHVEALAEALRSVAADGDLRATLRAGAERSADRYRPERAYEEIEREIEAAARGG